jgi:enamine deaminase RidA (YjgF/YER057c/UK114 family)
MADINRFTRAGATRARAVVHGGRVYTVATSPVKSASMEVQTRAALEQLDLHLAEAGSHKSRLLTVTVYITDMACKPDMNRAWDAWVDIGNPPQRACIGAMLEGDDLIELVAVAAVLED